MKTSSTMELPGAVPKTQAAQGPPPNRQQQKYPNPGDGNGPGQEVPPEIIGGHNIIKTAGYESIAQFDAVRLQDPQDTPVNQHRNKLIASSKGAEGKEEALEAADRDFEKKNSLLKNRIVGTMQTLAMGIQNDQQAVAPLLKMASGLVAFILTRTGMLPFSVWEKIKLSFLAFISALLLLMSCATIVVNLHSTGIEAFQNWWICWMFSPIAIIAFLPWELLERRTASLEGKEKIARVAIITGGVFAIITVWLFALIFPGMTIGVEDIIESALTGKNSGIPSWMRHLYVACQIMAESSLAAAAVMEIQACVSEHLIFVPKKNPALEPIEKEIERYRVHQLEMQRGLSELRSKLAEIESKKESLLADTAAHFDAQVVALGEGNEQANTNEILKNS